MRTYNASLQQLVIDKRRSGLRVGVSELHGSLIIILGAVHTTHHTLIITEEEDGKGSDGVDGYEKAALLKPVDNIRPGNEIHGAEVPSRLAE